MNRNTMVAAITLALGASAIAPQTLAQANGVKLNRTVLPISEPNYPRSRVLDARDAKAPVEAPNVLIVLVDDMGFGMPSAFGMGGRPAGDAPEKAGS